MCNTSQTWNVETGFSWSPLSVGFGLIGSTYSGTYHLGWVDSKPQIRLHWSPIIEQTPKSAHQCRYPEMRKRSKNRWQKLGLKFFSPRKKKTTKHLAWIFFRDKTKRRQNLVKQKFRDLLFLGFSFNFRLLAARLNWLNIF